MKEKFKVDGMVCAGCASRVESVIKSLKGVNSAEVNLLTTTATVDFDENEVSLSDIADAITKAGYTPLIEGAKKKGIFSFFKKG